MRMIYGDGYADIANREMGMDAARDSRYFNSLSANRAAQALAQQQAQAEAGNRLSWEQLLAQAAQQVQRRQDIQGQQGFENKLSLANLLRQTEGAEQHQSNVLADMALRRHGMDLQYGSEQRSDRALGRFEKLAPSLASDPNITEASLGTMLKDFTAEDLPVAQSIFRNYRQRLIDDEAERANATAMANKQIATEQQQIEMAERTAFAKEVSPTREDVAAMGAGTRWPINPMRWTWFGGSKASPDDVTKYKAGIQSDIMGGDYDGVRQPLPPSDASEIFREVSRNNKMAPSAYNEGTGRFEFTPRFRMSPVAEPTSPNPVFRNSPEVQLKNDIAAVKAAYQAGEIDRARATELLRELGGR